MYSTSFTGFERLSSLPNLEVLDLSKNLFNNSALSSLNGLSSLKYLDLGENQLNGKIRFNGNPTIASIQLDPYTRNNSFFSLLSFLT